MAIYIPSGVNETMNALSQWGQSTRADQKQNMQAAQAQINNLLQLGFNANDPSMQKALGTMMSGGNTFAILGGAKKGVEDLTSSLSRTGQGATTRSFAGDKQLQAAKAKNDLVINQEMLERTRAERDKIDSVLQQKQKTLGGQIERDVSGELLSAEDYAKDTKGMNLTPEQIQRNEELYKKLGQTPTDVNGEIDQYNYFKSQGLQPAEGGSSLEGLVGTLEGEKEKLNFQLEELGGAAKKNIEELRKAGINITPAQEKNLTDTGLTSKDSRRIVSNQTEIDKTKGGSLSSSQENVDKLEKEKESFLAREKKRVENIRQTGGKLSGTETQMRAKTRDDFKYLFDQAGSNEDKRKVYDDYVTTMKSIDDRYKRKGFYPSFEKAFRSLYTKPKGGTGYKTPSGGSFQHVYIHDENTGQSIEIRDVNARSKEEVLKIIKAKYPKYKVTDLENIHGMTKQTKYGPAFDTSLINRFSKDRKEKWEMDQGKKMMSERNQRNFNAYASNLTPTFSSGFHDTTLKKAVISRLGINSKDKAGLDAAEKLAGSLDSKIIYEKYKSFEGDKAEFIGRIIDKASKDGVKAAEEYAKRLSVSGFLSKLKQKEKEDDDRRNMTNAQLLQKGRLNLGKIGVR